MQTLYGGLRDAMEETASAGTQQLLLSMAWVSPVCQVLNKGQSGVHPLPFPNANQTSGLCSALPLPGSPPRSTHTQRFFLYILCAYTYIYTYVYIDTDRERERLHLLLGIQFLVNIISNTERQLWTLSSETNS